MSQNMQALVKICANHEGCRNPSMKLLAGYAGIADKTWKKKIVDIDSSTLSLSDISKYYSSIEQKLKTLNDRDDPYLTPYVIIKLVKLYKAIDSNRIKAFYDEEYFCIRGAYETVDRYKDEKRPLDKAILCYILALLITKSSGKNKWEEGLAFYTLAIMEFEKLPKETLNIFEDLYIKSSVTMFACKYNLTKLDDNYLAKHRNTQLREFAINEGIYELLTVKYMADYPKKCLSLPLVRNALVMVTLVEQDTTSRDRKLKQFGQDMIDNWPEMKNLDFKPYGIEESIADDSDLQYYKDNIHPKLLSSL